ncbi:putative nuclease HARBI1 [Condylostylus longicornis]|uniref:putative nuclease HARBI1 n=1 Tax=Condylostylus longicornis TaxID=2530218 RepID=UPI00244E1E73|nr:putative nuclease HARBI1 [Condylostylus longicornis]
MDLRKKLIKNYKFEYLTEANRDKSLRNFIRKKKSRNMKLLKNLQPQWHTSKYGRPSIPLDLALYITIWFLGNKGICYRDISDRFNVSLYAANESVKKVTKMISNLSTIKWPNHEQHNVIINNFNRNKKFPNIAGAVDGTHIKIVPPTLEQKSYYNRKGFYSILMQAICDSNFRFLDVFIGWPGRAHDASVWHKSPIGKALKEGTQTLPNNSHLVGDCAYPLHTYLMTPFKDYGKLTEKQRKFNYYLSSQRVHIEQSFGILKQKFKILDFINCRDLCQVKYIVMACVTLHNFIIDNSNERLDEIIYANYEEESDVFADNVDEHDIEASTKRNELSLYSQY